MKKYLGLEMGNSAYTEFKMKSGEFEQTEDCIMVGQVEAENEFKALDKIRNIEYNQGRAFDNLIVVEVK